MGRFKIYRCPECGFRYRTEELAKRCEEWCKKHHSCNTEITKYSIENER